MNFEGSRALPCSDPNEDFMGESLGLGLVEPSESEDELDSPSSFLPVFDSTCYSLPLIFLAFFFAAFILSYDSINSISIGD